MADEKEKLNRELRDLSGKAALSEPTLDVGLLKMSTSLAQRIRYIPEAILDSTLALAFSTKALGVSAKLAMSAATYSAGEFGAHLNRRIKDLSRSTEKPQSNFNLLSLMVKKRVADGKTCVVGAIKADVPTESRVKRKTQAMDRAAGERTVVQEITAENRQQEQTTKQVDRIYQALQKLRDRGHQVVDYFEFVTEPESFAETIENIFYVSFLVSQKLASLELDADGMPCLALASQGTEQSPQQSTGMTSIVAISSMEWKQILDAYQIRRGVIRRLIGDRSK